MSDMLALSTQIMRPIIYYFPKGTFGEVEKKYAAELSEIQLLNTLILADAKGDLHLFEHKIEQIELLKKEKILKSSVLKLIEFQAKNDAETFNYQLQDYLSDVNLWIETTDYIKKEAKTETHNYFSEIQAYLELQNTDLVAHRNELQERFGQNDKERLPKDELEKKTGLVIKETVIATNSALKPETNKHVKRKLPKLKVEDIDHYLLESVFKVDFTKIDNV